MGGWPQLRESRTVTSGQAPGTVIRCGLRDTLLSNVPVSIVLFFARPLPADDLAKGLARALAAVPVFGGRMRTTGDLLEIVCSDEGVPMEFYTIDDTLAEAVSRVAMPNSGLANHCEATKARDGGLPLLTVRVTEFSDGGTAVCTSFHHSVGDMQTYMLFMQAWSAAVDGGEMPEAVVVEDRDGYLDEILPPSDGGMPSFRLPEPAEAEALAAELAAAARANRTVQIYFGTQEVARMRDELAAEAGRWLSTNDVLAAHIHTALRDLDDYDGVRHISMPVNIRPRLDLPPAVVGNILSEVYVPCAPETTTAQFAAQIRATMDDLAVTPPSFRADERLIEQLGRDRLPDLVPYAFDPPRRTFSLSNWTRFGVVDVTLGGQRPVMVSPTTAVSLPWVAWLVEGFDGAGYLLTIVVPVRFAGKLRGEAGRARLHRFRADDDELPPLAVAAGRII
ncbi:acyltransferase [Dactylosporangium sp. NPDC000555]|uniref:acyltransferase n=1 Tax=Dactylosporangium sp. NPDC000555 TaxID=3154260 RepID=UPI003329EA58